ncbi:MAG TPA: hypothetical protein VHC94_11025 [Nitrobacter sp.]|nr:hypothetical protein [Nitrobacter sp.]
MIDHDDGRTNGTTKLTTQPEPSPANPASTVLRNYLYLLDRFFGMYLDACMGFEAVGDRMARTVKPDQYDKKLSFGEFDNPNDAAAKYMHATTFRKFIFRNKRNSENQLLLAQSTIVFIYSIWDTLFRPQYCSALGKPQKDVLCDAMGDLRLYRHAIVHNNMKLEKATNRLSFIDVGNAVVLTQQQMQELFSILFDELSDLNFRHTGERLNLPFFRQLNPSR